MASANELAWVLKCDPETLARGATGAATRRDLLAARIVQRILALDGMRPAIDTDTDSTYGAMAFAGDLVRMVASEIRQEEGEASHAYVDWLVGKGPLPQGGL